MLKDKMTIIINTCDKFKDIWHPNIELLNTYWADREVKTFLVTDLNTDIVFDNVNILSAGVNKELPDRIKFSLNYIDTEYIFLTLEDYFLIKNVENRDFNKLIRIMEDDQIDYIRLFPIPKHSGKYTNYDSIFKIDLNGNYKVNLYPGLWRKSFLEKTLNNSLNAWQYEVSLTKTARESNARCLMTKGNEFVFIDGVRKGKFLHKSYKYLKKKELYFGDRKLISWIEELKLNILFYSKEIIPNGLFIFIKKILIKNGYSFYSDIE